MTAEQAKELERQAAELRNKRLALQRLDRAKKQLQEEKKKLFYQSNKGKALKLGAELGKAGWKMLKKATK